MAHVRYDCLVCGSESKDYFQPEYPDDVPQRAHFCRGCRNLVKRVRERFRRAGVVPSQEQVARAARVLRDSLAPRDGG